MAKDASDEDVANRRPIAARGSLWAQRSAAALSRAGISANAISLSSVGFAIVAAAAFLAAPIGGAWLYLVAAVSCPLRLVANLLDGMVAVEEGRATPSGPIYNEIPDRIADVVILAAAGYAAAIAAPDGTIAAVAIAFGWLAAVAALLTAYVREMGRGLGSPADFGGPFAKQQRMWLVIGAALLCTVLPRFATHILTIALIVVTLGGGLTAALRLRRLAAFLRARAQDEGPP
ncbi:MAG: CDP-alcohol phosphatidyltransferase family protein [Pseudomonadota bacterium]